ncbi:hypothetical protein ACOMHN_019594 [Nucella lapillus]
MILTETWLSETGHETSCKLMTSSGFVLKSYSRASKGGGIAVIFRESLVPHMTFKKALPFRHSTFEVVELTISCSGKSTCIVCIYRPPPNAKNKFSFPLFLEEFEELVDYHNTHSPNIILIGDFNIHFDNPHNSDTKQICELLTSYELVQLVDKPTRKTHILDWIISREASDLALPGFKPTTSGPSGLEVSRLNIEKLSKAIDSLASGKAPGIDGIPPGKQTSLLEHLHNLLLQCWEDGTVPQDMRDANIITLYKNKGDRSDCNNYRGISLLSIVGRPSPVLY